MILEVQKETLAKALLKENKLFLKAGALALVYFFLVKEVCGLLFK